MTRSPARSELVSRIASAALLIVIALALTYAGPVPFAGLILVFATLMTWEWGRIVRHRGFDSISAMQVIALNSAGVLILLQYVFLPVAVILAATLCAFTLHRLLSPASDAWWSAAGVYYAGFPAIALIAIRQDPVYGFSAILYLFAVVWSTDTGAFVSGRLLKGPRLMPAVSPNKTWAGLLGGLAAGTVSGLAFAVWFGQSSAAFAVILSFSLALAAQAGDLCESALKRSFGVKHSSGLIPGHGGVLDRLDGLVFAALGAGLFAVAMDPLRPGRALMVW